MANRLFKQFQHTLEQGVVKLFGTVVLGSSGAVSSVTGCKGFTVAKTATETGRYTVTLQDSFNQLLNVGVNIIGAADAAYTDGKGMFMGLLRNVSVNDSTPTFDIQFNDPDTNVDAEPADSVTLLIEITLKNSTAF